MVCVCVFVWVGERERKKAVETKKLKKGDEEIEEGERGDGVKGFREAID